MAQATWESLFAPNANQVRKTLFGSVLVQDYNSSNTTLLSSSYNPFDTATGQLSASLLTTDGWNDLGYLDESGVEFTPTFTTAKTQAWQTRREIRQDATAVDETAKLNAIQTNAITEALYNNMAMNAVSSIGAQGWNATAPVNLSLIYRSLLFIGVDGTGPSEQYTVKFYPKALMVKQEKQSWNAKTEVQYGMSFMPVVDPVSGFAVKWFHDGPGWRALGGSPNPVTALTSPSKTATSVNLSWTAPATDSTHPAATSYTVTTTTGGGTVVGTPQTVTTTSAVVSGLTTATAYTFSVVASAGGTNSTPVTISVTTS